jgi:lipopolysaccharide export system protein LptA
MRIFRITLSIAVFIFAVGLFYWALFIPKEDVSQRIYQTIKEQEKRADLLFKKVTFEEVSAGIKYWQLEAEVGFVNKSTGIATLQNAKGTFFKKGRPVLRFRSPGALWDMKKKEIFLDKPLGYDIALEHKIARMLKTLKKSPFSIFNLPAQYQSGEPGYWFQANNLSWKLSDEQLVCTGGILLNKGEVSGYAQKLQGDVGLEKVRLEGSPRIVMKAAGSSPVTIEAQAFEVLGPQDLFIAHENPKITWQDANITSQTARYLQADKKIELSGNVKINYRDIYAEGNSADYYTLDQKVILSGNALAKQGDNRLSGEKVLVSLKDSLISVLGKSRVVITQ